MNWIFLAIITAVFYGMYNFFIKLSSGNINQVVGAVILQIVATMLGVVTLLILKLTGMEFNISSKGVWYAVLAGVMVGLAEILSFFVFSKGAPVSVGTAIIIGGSVVVAGVIGFFMKEDFGIMNFLGILAIIIGIILFTTK
ncbi:MAG: EamA family transporter [Candidatus Magasanikiibacteriota bacterium]